MVTVFCSESIFLCQRPSKLLPTFFIICNVSGFMLRSLIHLELSFLQGNKYRSIWTLLHTAIQFAWHVLTESNWRPRYKSTHHQHLVLINKPKIHWKRDNVFSIINYWVPISLYLTAWYGLIFPIVLSPWWDSTY